MDTVHQCLICVRINDCYLPIDGIVSIDLFFVLLFYIQILEYLLMMDKNF